MSDTLANEYADSVAEGIRQRVADGAPFGTDEETGEELSAYDYLSDVLDIEYRVGDDDDERGAGYRSAEVLIGFGGPNAWIDTKTGELVVAWWSAPVRRDLPKEFVEGLDEALSELWAMR